MWSQERFAERAAARCRGLLKQTIRDIAVEPKRPGSQERRDPARGVRTFRSSAEVARSDLGAVGKPRHFLGCRRRNGVIDVVRVLHDASAAR